MVAAQVTEPARKDMAARAAATTDTRSPKIRCPQINRMGPLGGTKVSEPRPPKISGRNHTYMTRNVNNRMEPSSKRQHAARELLASDEELSKVGLWRMVLV